MKSLLNRLFTLLAGSLRNPTARELNGFIDTLLQKFEDSRPGLPDAAHPDRGAVERYFLELYDREIPRLLETIRAQSPHLTPAATKQFLAEVDSHVRQVVVPAYARLASRFTQGERNDFYHWPEPAHVLERVLLALVGMLIGVLVIRAPFIPLWSKEVVLPFILAGLFFPELRRVLAIRRYARELGALVERADREIARLDVAYLTSRQARAEAMTVDAEVEPAGAEQEDGRPDETRSKQKGGA